MLYVNSDDSFKETMYTWYIFCYFSEGRQLLRLFVCFPALQAPLTTTIVEGFFISFLFFVVVVVVVFVFQKNKA